MSSLGEAIESYIAKIIYDSMPTYERIEQIAREEISKRADAFMDVSMSTREAAEYVGICEPILIEGVRAGEIPGRYVAGKFRFSRLALHEWLKGDGPRLAAVKGKRRAG